MSDHFVLAWHHDLTQGIQDAFFKVNPEYVPSQANYITQCGENVGTVNTEM